LLEKPLHALSFRGLWRLLNIYKCTWQMHFTQGHVL
jgi:hypothetical protein